MKKVHFVINGRFKHTERTIKEIEEAFDDEFLVWVSVTNGNGHAIELARNAVLSGTDYLIAAGGDGTMSEVVNGIMQVEKSKRENLIVGLYPFGSGNDFARTFKLSKKLSDLQKLMRDNSVNQIDIGRLEYKNMKGEDSVRYFNNITDIGLGAEVAKRVNEGKKIYGPNFDFFKATVLGFLNYKRKQLKIESENFNWSGRLLILCLANGKYFGSGLGIAPQAKINDGKISITLAADVSLFDYLKNLSRIRKCLPVDHPQIIYKEVENCSIEPIGTECLIEADGEMIGKIPLKASMLQNEINFLAQKNV
ncbi:MAG: diacylglycerol kinase family lipid kinase [Ignavibacteriales bacterium]|nr:diacylglycerol kinase family lipid kinase [Ignavibacteriales bacterium]